MPDQSAIDSLLVAFDADKAFWQATVQCAMDIEETFLQDEEQEETEYETEIVI
jgi:hypothetical protein